MEYARYMRSSSWAERKRRYFLSHAKQCRACGRVNGIDLHHMSYESIGAEPDSDLVALCQECHRRVHQIHDKSGGAKHTLMKVTKNFIASKQRRKSGPVQKNRKKGERRLKQCEPAKAKPEFIPRNRRNAVVVDGKLMASQD